MSLTTAILASALALAAPPGAPENTVRTGNEVQVKYCLISMIDHVRLSAREAAQVMQMNVVEGQTVKEGDVLVQLDDSDSQIKRNAAHWETEVARTQASSDERLEASRKTAEVAKTEYEQALEINEKSPGAVSKTEVRRAKLTYERSLLEAEVAQLEMKIAEQTVNVKEAAVKAAENEIDRRRIVAPIDGEVDHVMIKKGEWVQPGQPAIEIVRLDRLRVEAFLNAYDVSPREVKGRPVIIEVPNAYRDSEGNPVSERFEGTIGFVSNQIVSDGAYRVWVEFENRRTVINGIEDWAVRPGMTANMTVSLAGGARQVPLAPASRPATRPAAVAVPRN